MKSKSLGSLALTALVLLALGVKPANATLIPVDFEEFSAGGGNGSVLSNGFMFTSAVGPGPSNAYTIVDGNCCMDLGGPTPGNGTKYLAVDYWDNSTVYIGAVGGGIFGLKQLDVAAQYEVSPICIFNPLFSCYFSAIDFTGYLADGGIITETLTLDGINDGSGPLNDFQTFDFTGQWNRLTMLEISALHGVEGQYTTLAIDNLVFRSVPEPGTLGLFAGGLIALGFMRLKATLRFKS